MSLNHTTWRTHPYSLDLYAYVHVPEVIFECGVDVAYFNWPMAEIAYDDVTVGSYTDILPDMTFRIVAPDGTVRGYGRIRKAATADTLYINRISSGEIFFYGYDRIEVLDDYRVWAKFPYIDSAGTIYKDYDRACTNEGYYPPPIVVCGPGYATYAPGNFAIVPFQYAAPLSYAWGHSSQNVKSAAWDFDYADGILTGGSPANGWANIGFTGGFRWVHITGEEDVNDDTWTRHVPVFVGNDTTHPCTPIEVKNLRGTPEGWQVAFNILDADTAADVPPGSLVMIWAQERYGSSEGSLMGWTDREHMLFVGWLSEDQSIFDDELSDAQFVAVGPLGKLRELPMLAQNTSRNGNTTLWNIIFENTMFKHLCYLLMWHSTILNVADLVQPDWAGDYPVVALDAGQEGGVANLYDVVDGRPGAGSVGARFTCDHQGTMYLRKHPTLMTVEERVDANTNVNLLSSDWTGKINIRQNHRLPVAWLRSSAIVASGDTITALRGIAPGFVPAQGEREERMDQLLVKTSYELIARTGRQFARINNPIPPFPIDILNGGIVADPAWLDYITLTLDAETNKRGITFDADEFLLNEVDISFDHDKGTMSQRWVIEPETNGMIAELDEIPSINNMPAQPYAPVPSYTPVSSPVGMAGVDRLIYVDPTGIYYTDNPGADANWALAIANGSLPGNEDYPWQVRVDPSNKDNLYILTGHSRLRFYYVEDAFSGDPTYNLIGYLSSSQPSPQRQNAAFEVGPGGEAILAAWGLQGTDGSLWVFSYPSPSSLPYLTIPYLSTKTCIAPQFGIYVGANLSYISADRGGLLRSNSLFITGGSVRLGSTDFVSDNPWATAPNPDTNTTWDILPDTTGYNSETPGYSMFQAIKASPSSDSRIYVAEPTAVDAFNDGNPGPAGATGKIRRRNADGSWTNVAPYISDISQYTGVFWDWSYYSHAREAILVGKNPNIVTVACTDLARDGYTWLMRSTDGGSNWTELPYPGEESQAIHYNVLSGLASDDQFILVSGFDAGHMYWSEDGGQTWSDTNGDFGTEFHDPATYGTPDLFPVVF